MDTEGVVYIEKLLIIIIEHAIPKTEMKEIPVMQIYSPYSP
jgi:hypothetical protein